MKKVLVLFVMVSALFVGCQKDELPPQEEKEQTEIKPIPQEVKTEATLAISFNEYLDNTLYPSFIYSYAGLKDENGNHRKLAYFILDIDTNKKIDAKIKLKSNKFTSETVEYITIEEGDNQIGISPKWNFDNFINIRNPGQTYFDFEIIDTKNDKVIASKSFQIVYRSINECVFALNKGEMDFRSFFASYVNEDSKLIDAFLSQVMRKHNQEYSYPLQLQGWVGYQGGKTYLDLQVLAIVNQLYRLGMQYSNITTTSNYSEKVASQYVRMIDESLFLQNTNCVDGTVLLASILEKIGIRCFLVTEPGHMYLAYCNEDINMTVGNFDISKLTYVETTEIGSGNLMAVFQNKTPTQNTLFFSVRDARKDGIKPIQ